MRILVIVQYYPPERGAVRYTANLARGLTDKGHDVTVVTALPHYPSGVPYHGFGRWLPVRRQEDGVRVIRVPVLMASNRQPWQRVIGFFTFMLSSIPWVVMRRRPDVIIASMPPPTVAVTAIIGSLIHRRRYIALLRDIEPLRTLTIRGLAVGAVGRALIRLSMWLYRVSRRIVVVHPREIEALRPFGIPDDRVAVIGHGLDLDARPAPASAGVGVLPRCDDRRLALYLGTIGHVHALTRLVEAFADDRIRRLPIDFVIVGDGEYSVQCGEIIRARRLSNVCLLPPVPLDHVSAILRQADILVCSFRDDSDAQLGHKFPEYCVAGKPILVHGRSVAARTVETIGNGLSCGEGDIEGLFHALKELTANPSEWAERGARGRAYARQHFSHRRMIEQWEALLVAAAAADA